MSTALSDVTSPAPAGDGRRRPTTAGAWTAISRSTAEHVGLLGGLTVLFVLLTLWAPNFLTQSNLLDVARQLSFTGIIAFGMTLVIASGEIDISVGSAIAFNSALFGVLVVERSWPLWLAALAVCALGTLVGAGAGLVRAVLNVPSFIVTLALFSAFSGLALLITDSVPLPITSEDFARWGNGLLLGIPIPALVFIVVFAVFFVIAKRTTFGRSVYAVGGNPEAARLSGIPVTRVRATLFATTGLLAALSGLLQTAQLGAGNPTIGTGVEFAVITAVIIGGADLYGGRGSMVGTLLGVVFIAVLNNGMVLLGVNSYAQNVANGAIVLVTVLISTLRSSGRRSRRAKTATAS
ncbi:monosaccharide ABC transporter membrane protein, CUT2 family [Thermomonospora echinospora]|uniref:Monosaccharide ABC transporter membrane protein, CUT2 family n=2 Tax=Thermomonospora echinospora TaxID=1992 RepID=A0A1H6E3F5_9ACTN|nr:monosaccharide ABC transporter membrane protein, CUT2 family [Thermomonospora echinospora]